MEPLEPEPDGTRTVELDFGVDIGAEKLIFVTFSTNKLKDIVYELYGTHV